VRQRVHTGRGGASGRQAQGQVRVEYRGGGQRAGVADVELPACAAGSGVYTIRVPVSGWGMVTPVVLPN